MLTKADGVTPPSQEAAVSTKMPPEVTLAPEPVARTAPLEPTVSSPA